MVAMTKIVAAGFVARHAVRFAVRTGQPVTRLAIEEAAQQMSHCVPGSFGRLASEIYNYKTAHRLARIILRNLGRDDLIGDVKR